MTKSDKIKQILKTLSTSPGVYQFLDKNNTIIYVGKAKNLKNRVSSYFNKIKSEKGEIEVLSKGSSLKLCMVAEGVADEYPRFAPTMEWDIAAGHAILEGAGKELIHFKSGEKMRYNKKDLLNGWFIAKNK